MFNFLFKKEKKTSLNMEEIIDNSHDSTCIFYNINENKYYRDYIDDFIDYYEIKNSNSHFDLIIDQNVKDKLKLNTTTFYNKKTNKYYYEYNNNLFLDNISGQLQIITKHNDVVIGGIRFKYKQNNPKFNNDVVKILHKNSIVYLFVKRTTKNSLFHFYKIIFTQTN